MVVRNMIRRRRPTHGRRSRSDDANADVAAHWCARCACRTIERPTNITKGCATCQTAAQAGGVRERHARQPLGAVALLAELGGGDAALTKSSRVRGCFDAYEVHEQQPEVEAGLSIGAVLGERIAGAHATKRSKFVCLVANQRVRADRSVARATAQRRAVAVVDIRIECAAVEADIASILSRVGQAVDEAIGIFGQRGLDDVRAMPPHETDFGWLAIGGAFLSFRAVLRVDAARLGEPTGRRVGGPLAATRRGSRRVIRRRWAVSLLRSASS